ncbi:hypothetical protein MKZ38_008333 [Zalerion maritima]|uniref:Uncharacterized protein n=1 Tax=Zalerion maritima TaxID=339359 RepID=A0AAD5RI10_9PEZI|nr:hypothetical protein MKZ38_008333 [Zalerion maritima]
MARHISDLAMMCDCCDCLPESFRSAIIPRSKATDISTNNNNAGTGFRGKDISLPLPALPEPSYALQNMAAYTPQPRPRVEPWTDAPLDVKALARLLVLLSANLRDIDYVLVDRAPLLFWGVNRPSARITIHVPDAMKIRLQIFARNNQYSQSNDWTIIQALPLQPAPRQIEFLVRMTPPRVRPQQLRKVDVHFVSQKTFLNYDVSNEAGGDGTSVNSQILSPEGVLEQQSRFLKNAYRTVTGQYSIKASIDDIMDLIAVCQCEGVLMHRYKCPTTTDLEFLDVIEQGYPGAAEILRNTFHPNSDKMEAEDEDAGSRIRDSWKNTEGAELYKADKPTSSATALHPQPGMVSNEFPRAGPTDSKAWPPRTPRAKAYPLNPPAAQFATRRNENLPQERSASPGLMTKETLELRERKSCGTGYLQDSKGNYLAGKFDGIYRTAGPKGQSVTTDIFGKEIAASKRRVEEAPAVRSRPSHRPDSTTSASTMNSSKRRSSINGDGHAVGGVQNVDSKRKVTLTKGPDRDSHRGVIETSSGNLTNPIAENVKKNEKKHEKHSALSYANAVGTYSTFTFDSESGVGGPSSATGPRLHNARKNYPDAKKCDGRNPHILGEEASSSVYSRSSPPRTRPKGGSGKTSEYPQVPASPGSTRREKLPRPSSSKKISSPARPRSHRHSHPRRREAPSRRGSETSYRHQRRTSPTSPTSKSKSNPIHSKRHTPRTSRHPTTSKQRRRELEESFSVQSRRRHLPKKDASKPKPDFLDKCGNLFFGTSTVGTGARGGGGSRTDRRVSSASDSAGSSMAGRISSSFKRKAGLLPSSPSPPRTRTPKTRSFSPRRGSRSGTGGEWERERRSERETDVRPRRRRASSSPPAASGRAGGGGRSRENKKQDEGRGDGSSSSKGREKEHHRGTHRRSSHGSASGSGKNGARRRRRSHSGGDEERRL